MGGTSWHACRRGTPIANSKLPAPRQHVFLTAAIKWQSMLRGFAGGLCSSLLLNTMWPGPGQWLWCCLPPTHIFSHPVWHMFVLLQALQHNNDPSPDHGIEVMYRFGNFSPWERCKYFG